MERFYRYLSFCHSERSEESISSCHSEPSEESISSCHSERSEESRETLSKPLSSGFFTSFSITGNESLHSYFSSPTISDLFEKKEEIAYLSEKYLSNEFSLFGKNWKKARLLNENNEEKIDWHYDILTDFKWDNTILGKRIKLNQGEGVDIKNIWELGRMQHLLIFPFASFLAQKSTKYLKDPNVYFEAFQKQILDFIESNKFNYGVHWSVAMEVAIRAVNWLLAYDFYRNAGFHFNEQFSIAFSKSLSEHLAFICENLEWSNGIRGNHYLANIVGMLFLSAYLPTNEFTNKTLFFAIQELCNEIIYQFNEDGGNFEASTCYHYFSTEIILFGLAMTLSLKEDKINELLKIKPCKFIRKKEINSLKSQHFFINEKDLTIDLKPIIYERINRIFDFSVNLLKNDGSIEQIGDNDSGFFASFYNLTFNFLNCKQSEVSHNISNKTNFEIHHYAQNDSQHCHSKRSDESRKLLLKPLLSGFFTAFRMTEKNESNSIFKNLLKNEKFKQFKLKTKPYFFYKDFGIYIKRTETYFSTIRCGNIGQKGKGGHSHNDQLSFTLKIFGKDIFVDPGTYSYTGYPEMRNLFRSTAYHNTLSIDEYEQNEWAENNLDDLFWFKTDRAKAKVIEYTDEKFVGEHSGFGKPHCREIHFNDDCIEGTDFCEIQGKKKVSFHLSPEVIIESSHSERSEESRKINGKTYCHSERSEESQDKSGKTNIEILRYAQNDKENTMNNIRELILRYAQNDKENKQNDKGNEMEIILTFSNGTCFVEDYNFSPGYNQIKKSKRIVIEFDEEKLNWKLQFCKKENNV